jgi:hypothetical protein
VLGEVDYYGLIRNFWLLRKLFEGVTTVKKAEVAPVGTVAVMNVAETFLKLADTEPNFTPPTKSCRSRSICADAFFSCFQEFWPPEANV